MTETIQYLGLDVHADAIACAVAAQGGEVLELGVIPNSEDAVARLLKRVCRRGPVRCCYEAGPTGFALYRQITSRKIPCEVIAPSLIPTRSGDRIKTDRRDAQKLARLYRAGELANVWVPDEAQEALRDLVRCREAAVQDQTRARNRVTKFLLRHGIHEPAGTTRWTQKYHVWLSSQRFEHRAAEFTFAAYLSEVVHVAEHIRRIEREISEVVESAPTPIRDVVENLQALRGIGKLASVTLVAELGSFARFSHPSELMGYSGLVPREHSSGKRIRHGGITKTGDAHLRRVLVEAAWTLRRRPGLRPPVRARRAGIDPQIVEIAAKAQQRLHLRYWRLMERGKDSKTAVVAIARELLGFVWDVGTRVENAHKGAART